ncbi:uncharacterized protein METZ01_LOCUS208910 [marine metagenome]|uniref:Uncharacterized protein n=1 Tax=marine metagenome TaxID=408172 RepID=A0A382EZ95_9ZZZZ
MELDICKMSEGLGTLRSCYTGAEGGLRYASRQLAVGSDNSPTG